MKYYETLYIVGSDVEDDRLSQIQDEVNQQVNQWSGNVINSYVWGKRKLAYPIENHNYGTYLLLQYETEKSFVDEFNNWLKLNRSILRHIVVRLDEPIQPREIEPIEVIGTRKEKVKESVESEEKEETPDEDQSDEEPVVEETVEE